MRNSRSSTGVVILVGAIFTIVALVAMFHFRSSTTDNLQQQLAAHGYDLASITLNGDTATGNISYGKGLTCGVQFQSNLNGELLVLTIGRRPAEPLLAAISLSPQGLSQEDLRAYLAQHGCPT